MPSKTIPAAAADHATAAAAAVAQSVHSSCSTYAFALVVALPYLPRNHKAALFALGAYADAELRSADGYRGCPPGRLGVLVGLSESSAAAVLRELVKIGALVWADYTTDRGERVARIPETVFARMG